MTELAKNKFICKTCGKEYKQESACSRHELNCGVPPCAKIKSVKPKKKKEEPSLSACTCEVCGKSYKTISAHNKHNCVTRLKKKDTAQFQLAITMWEYALRKMKAFYETKVNRTYVFITKSEYNTFMDLAEFLISRYDSDGTRFIDYLVTNDVPMYEWTKVCKYDEWIASRMAIESLDDGITRSINTIKSWSEETGYPVCSVFQKMTPDRFLFYFQTNQLSPWIIFASNTFNDLVIRMNNSEQSELSKYIDFNRWGPRVNHVKVDVSRIKSLLLSVGI